MYGAKELRNAARKGNVTKVRRLLAKGADVNAADGQGSTPLHNASVGGHDAAIKVLVDAGADVRATNNIGWTALHYASINGHVAAAKVLVAAEADLRATDGIGRTALHHASLCGYVDVIDMLAAAGAVLRAMDNKGQTPRDIAMKCGEDAAIELLARLEAAGDPHGAAEAAKRARREAEQEEQSVDHGEAVTDVVSGDERTASDTQIQRKSNWQLFDAAGKGDAAEVRRLLDAGAEVRATDEEGWTALHWAGYNGHAAVVEVLVAAGADLRAKDINGETPLDLAMEEGEDAAAVLLARLEAAGDPRRAARAAKRARLEADKSEKLADKGEAVTGVVSADERAGSDDSKAKEVANSMPARPLSNQKRQPEDCADSQMAMEIAGEPNAKPNAKHSMKTKRSGQEEKQAAVDNKENIPPAENGNASDRNRRVPQPMPPQVPQQAGPVPPPKQSRPQRLNGGWQSDKDMDERRKMIPKIVQLLRQRKPNAPQNWVNKLPQNAKHLEELLYRSAPSFAAYNDISTLDQRLQQLAMDMGAKMKRLQHERQQQQQAQPQQARTQGEELVDKGQAVTGVVSVDERAASNKSKDAADSVDATQIERESSCQLIDAATKGSDVDLGRGDTAMKRQTDVLHALFSVEHATGAVPAPLITGGGIAVKRETMLGFSADRDDECTAVGGGGGAVVKQEANDPTLATSEKDKMTAEMLATESGRECTKQSVLEQHAESGATLKRENLVELNTSSKRGRSEGDDSHDLSWLANEEQEVSVIGHANPPRRIIRNKIGVARMKMENLLKGDVRCPDPRCNRIISVHVGRGCNVLTCTNHRPQFLYFCMHCKKIGENGNDIIRCECPKRNTEEDHYLAQEMRNKHSRKNPEVVD